MPVPLRLVSWKKPHCARRSLLRRRNKPLDDGALYPCGNRHDCQDAEPARPLTLEVVSPA